MRSTLLYRLIGDGSHIEVLFELGAEHVVVDNNGEVRTKCLYEDEVAEAAGIAAAVGAAGERHERHGERRGRHEIEVRVPGGLTRWVFECDEGFPHPLVRRMYLLAMVAICRSG